MKTLAAILILATASAGAELVWHTATNRVPTTDAGLDWSDPRDIRVRQYLATGAPIPARFPALVDTRRGLVAYGESFATASNAIAAQIAAMQPAAVTNAEAQIAAQGDNPRRAGQSARAIGDRAAAANSVPALRAEVARLARLVAALEDRRRALEEDFAPPSR